jgi:hypothetical protein
MTIQIASVEATLHQNRVVRLYHAIGCEVGALEWDCHHPILVIRFA